MTSTGSSTSQQCQHVEPSDWCARSDGSELLGGYDGVETWTIYAATLLERQMQVVVHHFVRASTTDLGGVRATPEMREIDGSVHTAAAHGTWQARTRRPMRVSPIICCFPF